ncbi:MAG: 4Fe-4S binding protein [Desulfotignum sp.]
MAFFITSNCTGCTACKNICPTGAISGEKKQQHTVCDTACIDCGACGRICPAGAVANPFGRIVSKIPKKNWVRPYFNLDLCMACSICVEACPANALDITLQKVKDLHPYPFLIREAQCMGCGFCARACPVDAVTLKERNP